MLDVEIIETKRLKLQILTPEDISSVFANYDRAEIKKLLGHRTDEAYETEAYKNKNGYSSYNRRFKMFLLTDKITNNIIGRCSIHNWNDEHKRGELGYMMEDENYKRKGLMTETVAAVIDYGFNKLNLHRLEAMVGRYNIPSLRLMEIFGFKQEAVLREHFYVNGVFEDSLMFSILRSEYLAGKNPA